MEELLAAERFEFRLRANSFVQTIRGSFVQQIELASDASSL
jgi:hypothetical protein